LAAINNDSDFHKPIQDLNVPVQSCSGPPETLFASIDLLSVKNQSQITTDFAAHPPIEFPIISIDFFAAIQGCTLIISVTISRFLGWFRSLLLCDLFLKPENSNKRLIIDETTMIYSRLPLIRIKIYSSFFSSDNDLLIDTTTTALIIIVLIFWGANKTIVLSLADYAVHHWFHSFLFFGRTTLWIYSRFTGAERINSPIYYSIDERSYRSLKERYIRRLQPTAQKSRQSIERYIQRNILIDNLAYTLAMNFAPRRYSKLAILTTASTAVYIFDQAVYLMFWIPNVIKRAVNVVNVIERPVTCHYLLTAPPPEPPPYFDQTVYYYPSFDSRPAIRFATASSAAAFAFATTATSAVIFALHQYLLASSTTIPESGSAIYFAIYPNFLDLLYWLYDSFTRLFPIHSVIHGSRECGIELVTDKKDLKYHSKECPYGYPKARYAIRSSSVFSNQAQRYSKMTILWTQINTSSTNCSRQTRGTACTQHCYSYGLFGFYFMSTRQYDRILNTFGMIRTLTPYENNEVPTYPSAVSVVFAIRLLANYLQDNHTDMNVACIDTSTVSKSDLRYAFIDSGKLSFRDSSQANNAARFCSPDDLSTDYLIYQSIFLEPSAASSNGMTYTSNKVLAAIATESNLVLF